MKKTIVIWGISELSQIISKYMQSDDRYEVVAYTLDDYYVKQESFLSKPLIPFSKLAEVLGRTAFEILVTVGYGRMNDVRRDIIKRLLAGGYAVAEYIHPTSLVYSSRLGIGNIILENCSVGAFTELGDGNIIYPSTTISHHSKIGSFNFFSVECAVAGHVIVGDNCFFGVNCTVKNELKIANHTLVGAATYIAHDTDEYGVYVPERTVKLNKSSMDMKL